MNKLTGLLLATLTASTVTACSGVEVPPTADDAADVDAGPPPAGKTWDLTEAFPGAVNPNGVWTYGYRAGLDGALVEYLTLSTDVGAAHTTAWYDPANHDSDVPNVWLNTNAETVAGLAAGMVAMHPGLRGEYAVIRFVAPEAGTYAADIQFFDGDTGATDATVRVGAETVFAADVTGENPSFSVLPIQLDAGQSIELLVGPGADGYSDTTPVTFTVHEA